MARIVNSHPLRPISFASPAVNVERREDGVVYLRPKAPLGDYPARITDRLQYWGSAEPNRFAATDILAVEALSVKVPPNSAAKLIDTEAEEFSTLLRQIPADKDLWEVEASDLGEGSPALALYRRLKGLHGVGPVTATKLMASKRPRLMPVIDSLVSELRQPPGGRFWLSMRNQLADPSRRKKIADVVSCAPEGVTMLRRIDVAVWMHVKGAGK